MTTYSGEDGVTGTDQPDQPGLPGGPDDAPGTPVSEDSPAVDYPYPEDDHSYNATDVLPAPVAGGRLARRRAEEEARRAEAPTGAKAAVTGGPSGPARAIIPLALAVVSVIALAAAWMHLQSDRADQTSSPAPAASSTASPQPSSSPSSTPSSSPSASTSPKPSPSSTPSTAVSPTTSAPPVTKVDRSVPVVVLNATNRPGLAKEVAAKLERLGWKVTSVGNWTKGGISATTIFLNGHVAARDTIIKDFPAAEGRVDLPLPGMPKQRMVIVIGKDYPA